MIKPPTTITEFDSPGRYFVPASKPGDAPYLVDLTAYGGAGRCACKDWECRIGPFRDKGEVPQKPECRHITAARNKFLGDRSLPPEAYPVAIAPYLPAPAPPGFDAA